MAGPCLIIGATGYIGRFIVEASLGSGRRTYVLVRPRPAGAGGGSARAALLESLREKGAVVLEGHADDKAFLQEALKENGIEVVISAVGGGSVLDQLALLDAIKDVGTVKRFLPSEFGHDVDKAIPVEPALSFYEEKRKVRRAVEAAGVPYTYICCNSIAGWPYHDKTHPSEISPPTDRFLIYGDGDVKVYFVAGGDIGEFTMKAAYDERAANKSVHFRPPCNLLNLNEMATLWESKIGRTLPRIFLSEEDLLAIAKKNVIPPSIVAALTHDIFINGCQVNYSLDDAHDVDVTRLYPDAPFRTVDDCFSDYNVDQLAVPPGRRGEDTAPMGLMSAPPPPATATTAAAAVAAVAPSNMVDLDHLVSIPPTCA